MATRSWIVSTGTKNWNTASSWDGKASVPATGDDIVVNLAGTYTITYNGGNALQYESFLLDNAGTTFQFPSGTRTFSVNHSGSSTLTLKQGLMSVTGGTQTINASNLAVTGGSLLMTIANAAINVTTQANISSGDVTLTAGRLNIGSVTAAANTTSLGSGGSLVVSGGTLTSGAFSGQGGSFAQSGGVIDITGGAVFTAGSATISAGSFTAGTISVGNMFTLSGGTLTADTGALSVSGVLNMSGLATLNGLAGGIANTGTVSGAGSISGMISGSGSVIATAGKLDLASAIGASSGINFQIGAADGSMLELDAAAGAGNLFQFQGAGGVLSLSAPTAFAGTVGGLLDTVAGADGHDDSGYIDLPGVTVQSGEIINGNTLHIVDIHGDAYDIKTAEDFTGMHVCFTNDSAGSIIWVDDTVCYTEGTRILTPAGEVPVEKINAGDQVMTLQGGQHVAHTVKWIGYRKLDLSRHPRPEFAQPVRIRRGAFGENLPHRDLLVSPPHCLFIDGKLVPAKMLVNGTTILRETGLHTVSYYHIELDRHAVLLAEGLPAESYLDTGNRAYFSNAGLALVLHPEFHLNAGLQCWETDACAPLLASPAAVRPIWQHLAQRAEAMGLKPPAIQTTTDAAMHLLADGRPVWPISVERNNHVFVLPPGVSDIRLVSRSAVPADLRAYTDDQRRLGVAVVSMILRLDGECAVIPADHPDLAQGWHAPEYQDCAFARRWTDGNARLPVPITDRVVTLEIRLDQTTTYQIEEAARIGEAVEAHRLAA